MSDNEAIGVDDEGAVGYEEEAVEYEEEVIEFEPVTILTEGTESMFLSRVKILMHQR
jgi:hypothetical protein